MSEEHFMRFVEKERIYSQIDRLTSMAVYAEADHSAFPAMNRIESVAQMLRGEVARLKNYLTLARAPIAAPTEPYRALTWKEISDVFDSWRDQAMKSEDVHNMWMVLWSDLMAKADTHEL